MGSISPTPLNKNSQANVTLIPWDFASPEHFERLVQQRIVCGWGHDQVEKWKAGQETGALNLQWVVLEASDPETETRVLQHTSAYPQEETLLLDSATSFGGKPRTIPVPQRSFIPVGHICLGLVPVEQEFPSLTKDTEGLYWISHFYISRALQGIGLGRAAMNTIENLAVEAPLFAKTLALSSINKVDPERGAKYQATGLVTPPFSNQEWYERRGYQAYDLKKRMVTRVDSTGKTWHWDFVSLKKDI